MSAAPRKRRRYRRESWNSLAAFMSREKSLLAEERPSSPRAKPTLARLAWLNREPDKAKENAR
jgi:hypothetical protein